VKVAAVRELLARHGLAPNRELGQHFLVDEDLAGRLVSLAGVEPGDRVIEIGTGLGALTRALASRGARVLSLEVDAGLVRLLRAESLLPEGVELVHADALRFDLAAAARASASPVRLVANLPYSISGPFLRRLLSLRALVVDWSLMLQKEVAARLWAGPGSRDYGSLAVLHRLCAEVTRVLELPPDCFHPRPAVRSSFVRVRPGPGPLGSDAELAGVERVVRAAFSRRRKTIANAMAGGCWEPERLAAALDSAGIEPGERAERVAPERFLALTRALGSP